MKLYELYKALDERYPISLRCEWDNDGIMCADSLEKEVNKVLIALDVTMDTVKYAIKNGFDIIISHHPLVFRAQKALTPVNYTQEKLIELIKNNVAVLSFHTRLDAAENGVNDVLASALGLESVQHDLLDPIGRIGWTKNDMELCDFAKVVKNSINAPFVLYSGEATVSKVYVVGGDGKDLIDNAIVAGCDTIVTGRASYNTAVDACDRGINIVEAGHFFTEHPVCYELSSVISAIDSKIYTEVYNSNKISAI